MPQSKSVIAYKQDRSVLHANPVTRITEIKHVHLWENDVHFTTSLVWHLVIFSHQEHDPIR